MQVISRFSVWHQWENRHSLAGIKYPGVYLVSYAECELQGSPAEWTPQIIYIGMTNAVGGLRSRLSQFDRTIAGKAVTHGGADRVRYKHRHYPSLIGHLYVSVLPFVCDVKSNLPDDLRVMGEVVQCEYNCLAGVVEQIGKLPEFNNKKLSRKFSRTTAYKG